MSFTAVRRQPTVSPACVLTASVKGKGAGSVDVQITPHPTKTEKSLIITKNDGDKGTHTS